MFELLSLDWCYVNKQVGLFAAICHCQTVSGCAAVSEFFSIIQILYISILTIILIMAVAIPVLQ